MKVQTTATLNGAGDKMISLRASAVKLRDIIRNSDIRLTESESLSVREFDEVLAVVDKYILIDMNKSIRQ